MTTTPAEAWAFELAADVMRNKMSSYGEDLFTIAYNMFDENLEERGLDGSRLYLSDPNDREPAVFVEKTEDGYDLVFSWEDEEKYREDLGEEFYADAARYLK